MQTKAEKYRIAAEIEDGEYWQCRNLKYPHFSQWGSHEGHLPGMIESPDWEIRIKPEPEPVKLVPLEWADVPPGSAIKAVLEGHWFVITELRDSGVFIRTRESLIPWGEMMTHWQILRPGGEWMPCSKPA